MISRRHAVDQSFRRILAIVGVLLVVLLITGVPVPPPSRKDHSSPFPCMDSHCGCMTAEQCWRECCCHTLAEKLAWAHEHGVTPPQYVLDQCDQNQAEETCCASHKRGTTSIAVSGGKNPCCASSTCCDHDEEDEMTPSLIWIVTMSALKCQGHDGWSLLANSIIVVQSNFKLVLRASLPSEDVIIHQQALLAHRTPPESPPPKHS